MYVSGSLYDFERRFHHLAFTSDVIASFKLEAANYANTVTGNLRYKWEKEYKNRTRDWTGSLFIGGEEPSETFYYESPGGDIYALPNGTDFYLQP